MGFLDRLRGGGDDPGIVAAGVPQAAEQRLRDGHAFSSGLSIADFALTHREGIRPVGQVMGSSVYKVAWRNLQATASWGAGAGLIELTQLSDAWNHARSLAVGRLQEEARLAGGHAVVDVTFSATRHEFLAGEIEIAANGTAVHLPEGGDAPVLTNLSLPDYVLLRRGGYRPVGIVARTSVFYIVPGSQTRQATTGWQRLQSNQELADFTQGVYAAREQALEHAGAQAGELGAGGLVGVTIDHDIEIREIDKPGRNREDLIVTFHILGTAIAPAGEHRSLDPQVVLRR
jgi:uncharacterized protein YbjQ (UPF0145 family)